MWADSSIFYHIYPLGYCGAFERNSFSENLHTLWKIKAQAENLKNLGITAVYLGPVFMSSAHGYDTADYYHIDSRLGDDEDMAELCRAFHNNGIKVILDGVFNHVGRDFWAFRDVLANKQASKYINWFYIDFSKDNHFNDGFIYKDWEGSSDLIELNLENEEVKEHIFGAVESWVEKFDIDGIRLDVAYSLSEKFIKELKERTNTLKSDFFLLGEMIHGDYNRLLGKDKLDSVTNYEFYKGIFSSFNSKNMFEIAHSVTRQKNLYKNAHLYTFLDNHDVSRIATSLKDKRDLRLAYTLLFALPGIPSIYYGGEFGYEGSKRSGDKILRPEFFQQEYNNLAYHIQNLCRIYKKHKSLSLGDYTELKLSNEFYAFSRKYEDDEVICVLNSSDSEAVYNNMTIPSKTFRLYHNGQMIYV